MYQDEIISEVWRNRDNYAKDHQYDLAAIVADLQSRQQQSLLVDRRKQRIPPVDKLRQDNSAVYAHNS